MYNNRVCQELETYCTFNFMYNIARYSVGIMIFLPAEIFNGIICPVLKKEQVMYL